MNRFFLIILIISTSIISIYGFVILATIITGTYTYTANPLFGLLFPVYMLSLAGFQKTKRK